MARWALIVCLLAGCGDDVPSCPPEANVGTCAADADCCEGAGCTSRCVWNGEGSVSLACGAPVGTAPAGAGCNGADECASGLCLTGRSCASPCASDSDCSDESRCARVWVLGDGARRASACVPQTNLPTLASDVIGPSRSITLTPVETARGVAQHLLLPHCDAAPRLERLTGPGGTLFDASALAPGAPAPINPAFAPFPGTITLTFPSGTSGADPGEVHTATFDSPAAFDHLVFEPSGGTLLPLEIFLVGVSEPPPETFDALTSMLVSAGLSPGGLRYHVIDGPETAGLEILDSELGELPELADLFALGAGRPPSLPIYLVRQIDFFLGFTGGIPAALGAPGAPGSGVVIGAEVAGDQLGLVIAHEVAHALGLFHLVEPDGTLREPLADTPVCPLAADADGDGLLSADECASDGATNLLFWSIERAGITLTPDQATVIGRSPVLR